MVIELVVREESPALAGGAVRVEEVRFVLPVPATTNVWYSALLERADNVERDSRPMKRGILASPLRYDARA
ncbi:hypothetical protein GCM10010987_25770 [Bradyrhizobium guangdongense]|uniref:Uncharacterized protein n=1 Tax=Bradyrhizobium guangdongense TaxID=1325090 RepID=A0A410V621_9BRAD|nr:hypothetical protein X265_16425 [Bradyrhizobium guangdongense]GGI23712.1 hypothetical protein GCM10010987_25770 [Bradyrhizobium guangdongense]